VLAKVNTPVQLKEASGPRARVYPERCHVIIEKILPVSGKTRDKGVTERSEG